VHALDDVEQIGRRRDLDADIDRLLAVEADFGFVIVGAERDVGDVLSRTIAPLLCLSTRLRNSSANAGWSRRSG
jgi:hypothetical protein